MSSAVENVKMIVEPVNESGSVEIKTNLNEGTQKKRSVRKRKERNFFINETYSITKRSRKRKRTVDEDESEPGAPVPPTTKELREMHAQQLANVFQKYIFKKLDSLDLPIDHEKTRVNGLVKSLNNAIMLKEKVFVSKNMGYLVSSSDGTLTYNVSPRAIADDLKYVCNCGEKYKDSERTSCKHCGSVIFHNMDNYFSEYLTKPYQPNVHLQLRHVNNMFNKFGIEKPTQNKIAEKQVSDTPCNQGVQKVEQTDFRKDDYLSYLMNVEHPTCQSC